MPFPIDFPPQNLLIYPMPQLNLKPAHKPVRDYYATLQRYVQHGVTREGAASAPLETLQFYQTQQYTVEKCNYFLLI